MLKSLAAECINEPDYSSEIKFVQDENPNRDILKKITFIRNNTIKFFYKWKGHSLENKNYGLCGGCIRVNNQRAFMKQGQANNIYKQSLIRIIDESAL